MKSLIIIVGLIFSFVLKFGRADFSGCFTKGSETLSSPVTTPRKWIEEALVATNNYRKKHGAEPLTIGEKICESAQWNAIKNIETESFSHTQELEQSYEVNCGENIYMSGTSTKMIPTPEEAIDSWYNEVKDYKSYGSEPPQRTGGSGLPVTGHFTALVWKGSKEMCIAYTQSEQKSSNGFYTVIVTAQYYPPGNVLTKYAENVQSENGKISSSSSSTLEWTTVRTLIVVHVTLTFGIVM